MFFGIKPFTARRARFHPKTRFGSLGKLKYVLRVAVTTRAGCSDGPEVPEFPEGACVPGGPTGPTGSTENNIIFYKQRNFVMLFLSGVD